jgi:ElaB/YqjD/DUF883 family membrane-anchored ribosome-binding protein
MSTQPDEPTRQSRASAAIGTASEKLQENPMAAIAGGLALGVLIGTLLPRGEREAALLGGLGARIGDAARDAYDAARSTGQEKLDELGLSKDGARDKVKTLLDGALEAASAAGTAARDALRGGEQQ